MLSASLKVVENPYCNIADILIARHRSIRLYNYGDVSFLVKRSEFNHSITAACYHSVQNLLFYSWLSKNVKIKIYRNIKIACPFCMGVKIGHSNFTRNVG